MVAREPMGQALFTWHEHVPPCKRCPYGGKLGHCKGPSTVESTLPSDTAFIGCFDTLRQHELYLNLSHRLPTVLQEHYPEQPILPRFIPVLEQGMATNKELHRMPVVGVSLKTILTPAGKLRYRTAQRLRRALKLPATASLVLIGTCKDDRLEKFWRRCEVLRSWQGIQNLRFEWATTATFSVYNERPRFDQNYNQDRNFATYEFLTRLGIPTIPFLFCYAPEDFERAAAWLHRHPEVTTIAALAQMADTTTKFQEFCDRLGTLHKVAPRPLKTLIVGAATAQRIETLEQKFSNLSFATSKPIQRANSGELATHDLRFKKVDKQEYSSEQLVALNLQRYQTFLAAPPVSRMLRTPTDDKCPTRKTTKLPLFDTQEHHMPKRIKVTRESSTGRNTRFHDNFTGDDMTRAQFVRQIEAGNYENYHVREINGVKTPVSNPDASRNNNLD